MGLAFRIVLRSGPTPGKLFPLEKPEMFIGRDLSNDVVINDPEISRRHSRLFIQNGGYAVEDMGSTNGTSVNGQRLVAPQLLHPGDVLTFGERVTLLYEAVDPTSDATVSAGGAAAFNPSMTPAAPVPQPAYPPAYLPNNFEAPPAQAPRNYSPPVQAPQQYTPVQQIPIQPTPQQMAYQPNPAPPVYEPAPSFANQIPMAAGMTPETAKAKTPIWPFIIIGLLLVVILVLVIDDFRLWCPLFGICN
jgi:predicted component of type VI protein secretion system